MAAPDDRVRLPSQKWRPAEPSPRRSTPIPVTAARVSAASSLGHRQDTGDHVASRAGIERAVAAGRDVAKAAAAQQRIKFWRQEGEWELFRLCPASLIKRAEARPTWRAPTRAADLLRADRAGSRRRRCSDRRRDRHPAPAVRCRPACPPLLPDLPGKSAALPPPLPTQPRSLCTVPSGARFNGRAADPDDVDVGRSVFDLGRGRLELCPVTSGFDPASPLATKTLTPAAASLRNFCDCALISPSAMKVSPNPEADRQLPHRGLAREIGDDPVQRAIEVGELQRSRWRRS